MTILTDAEIKELREAYDGDDIDARNIKYCLDEIASLKLELAESERISSGRLTTMNALYAETARLELERDAAIQTLGELATEVEKEPCTHAAYCRDETIWRREIEAAEAATLEMAVKHYDELAEFSKTVPMFRWAEPFYRNIAKILREGITPGQSSSLERVKSGVRSKREFEIAHAILCIAEGYAIHLPMKPDSGFYNVTMALCNSLSERVKAQVKLEEYRWCVSKMDRNHDCGDGQCDLCGHRIELEAAARKSE